jgi:hypothetical protein
LLRKIIFPKEKLLNRVKNKMNQKVLNAVLIIVIFLLTGALVYVLFFPRVEIPIQVNPNQKACPMLAKQCPDGSTVGPTGPNCELVCPVVQSSTSPQQSSVPVASKGAIYTNSDYGFKLNLPEGFEKYKPMVEIEPFEKGINYIFILLPTTNSKQVEENRVTHEKFPGYESVFAITAWEKTLWDNEINSAECKNNPNPGCPFESEVLGKTTKYVLELSLPNGLPSPDLDQLGEKVRANNAKLVRDAFELVK